MGLFVVEGEGEFGGGEGLEERRGFEGLGGGGGIGGNEGGRG